MDVREVLFLWFTRFLIKNLQVVINNDENVNNEIKLNEQLADELHKPIIRKF